MMKWIRRVYRALFPDPLTQFWANRAHIIGKSSFLTPLYAHRNHKILKRHNADIPCAPHIHPFATPHGLCGIFISYGAKIGTGCTIFHQVTIGSNTLPDSRGQGAPTIGNNVYIGAGAKIIGNVTVGDNARIGANCVVTFDVPANATVVLGAPKVIPHDTPRDNTFIPWRDFHARPKLAPPLDYLHPTPAQPSTEGQRLA